MATELLGLFRGVDDSTSLAIAVIMVTSVVMFLRTWSSLRSLCRWLPAR